MNLTSRNQDPMHAYLVLSLLSRDWQRPIVRDGKSHIKFYFWDYIFLKIWHKLINIHVIRKSAITFAPQGCTAPVFNTVFDSHPFVPLNIPTAVRKYEYCLWLFIITMYLKWSWTINLFEKKWHRGRGWQHKTQMLKLFPFSNVLSYSASVHV